jgi:hypothetical protein
VGGVKRVAWPSHSIHCCMPTTNATYPLHFPSTIPHTPYPAVSCMRLQIGPAAPLQTAESPAALRENLRIALDSFKDEPPFTIQRLCEVSAPPALSPFPLYSVSVLPHNVPRWYVRDVVCCPPRGAEQLWGFACFAITGSVGAEKAVPEAG